MLSDEIRDKDNNSYDKSPKHYYNNLKVNAGINPRIKDQPMGTALTNPNTKILQTSPHEVISIVTTHFERGKKRQHQNTYRTLHGHKHITRTTSL
jgi:hypothetical protein